MSDPAPAIGPAKVSSALAQVRVILCQTSLPANIGACARAMKTMGLSDLYLVNPKIFPHPDAEALASRATDILEHAHVCATLDEALSGTIFAVACTARTRDISPEVLAPREMASRMIEETSSGPVALVMGPEKYGLTGEEVGKCSVITSIPANPDYSSLNLAAALQVFSYEIRQAALSTLPADVGRDRLSESKTRSHQDDAKTPAPLCPKPPGARGSKHPARRSRFGADARGSAGPPPAGRLGLGRYPVGG
jgi:TrmH family RNA methyltransferase